MDAAELLLNWLRRHISQRFDGALRRSVGNDCGTSNDQSPTFSSTQFLCLGDTGRLSCREPGDLDLRALTPLIYGHGPRPPCVLPRCAKPLQALSDEPEPSPHGLPRFDPVILTRRTLPYPHHHLWLSMIPVRRKDLIIPRGGCPTAQPWRTIANRWRRKAFVIVLKQLR